MPAPAKMNRKGGNKGGKPADKNGNKRKRGAGRGSFKRDRQLSKQELLMKEIADIETRIKHESPAPGVSFLASIFILVFLSSQPVC